MGYRFRLHRRDLPGTPDIVLPAGAEDRRGARLLLASPPRSRMPQRRAAESAGRLVGRQIGAQVHRDDRNLAALRRRRLVRSGAVGDAR